MSEIQLRAVAEAKAMKNKMCEVRIRIPGDLRAACKLAALRDNMWLQDWFTKALQAYLIQRGINDPVIREIIKDWERG